MLVVILLILLRVMPFEIALLITRLLVRLYVVLSSSARYELREVKERLGRFPKGMYLDRAAFNLALTTRIGTSFSKKLARRALIEGEEHVEKLKDSGAVVATFHYGPWELLAEVFIQRGYRVGALVGRQRAKLFERYLAALRRRAGLKAVTSLVDASQGLRRGIFLATLYDKTRRAKGSRLGLPYPGYISSVIPTKLAKRTKVAVVPVISRFAEQRLKITIGQPDADVRSFFKPFFIEAPFEWLVWGE